MVKLCFPFLLIVTAFLAQGCAASNPDVNQWEYTGGPYGRNISAVLVDEKSPGLVYAGLGNGEVFSSVNEGRTWTKVSTIVPDSRINMFLADPDDPGRIYAATGTGVFGSADGAKTWTRLFPRTNSGPLPASRAIAIDPWKTNVLYAGLQGQGIIKSTDAGATWAASNGGDSRLAAGDPLDIRIDPARPDIVVAAVGGWGLVRSTNAGGTWSRITVDLGPAGALPIGLVANPFPSTTIVYATNAGSIYKSTNAGATWGPVRYGPEGGRVYTLGAMGGKAQILLAGTESGLLCSSDMGSTWTPYSNALPPVPVSAAFSASGQAAGVFVFGESIGMRRSSDEGKIWTASDAGLGGSAISLIRTGASGERIFAAVGSALLYRGPGTAWEPVGPGLVGDTVTCLDIDPTSPSTLLVTTTVGGFKSTDGGKTWQPALRDLHTIPTFVETHPWIHNRVFSSGEAGVFVSTDHGNRWKAADRNRTPFHVSTLTFTPTNAGVIHGSTRGSGVLQSLDGGITWESTRYGIEAADIGALTLDNEDPALCYAWSQSGLGFRSLDNGLEWNRYAPPWKAGDTVCVAADRFRPSSVVALVNSRQLFYSPSGGGTWSPIVTANIGARVTTLYWNAATATLFAGTRDHGVFMLPLQRTIQAWERK